MIDVSAYIANFNNLVNCEANSKIDCSVDTINELKRTYDNFFKDTTHHREMDDLVTPTESDTTENGHTDTNTNMDTTTKTHILTEILHDIQDMQTDILHNKGGFTLMYRGRPLS